VEKVEIDYFVMENIKEVVICQFHLRALLKIDPESYNSQIFVK
jgi:hypothetical protein